MARMIPAARALDNRSPSEGASAAGDGEAPGRERLVRTDDEPGDDAG